MLDAELVAHAYRDACRFDVLAFKPGNVSCESPGHDMDARDFLRSAAVSAPAIARAGASVGARIKGAILATHQAVGCNTNLGIVLLAAPLAAAVQSTAGGEDLASRLAVTLASLTREDAGEAFFAIQLAAPAGLGEAPEGNVNAPVEITLLEAMALSAGRDNVARQYACAYQDVFDIGLPVLGKALAEGRDLSEAVCSTYLAFLALLPDSHLVRKYDRTVAEAVRDQARAVADLGKACEDPAAFGAALHALDRDLKAKRRNPGTSADLTVASLFALFLTQALQDRGAGHH